MKKKGSIKRKAACATLALAFVLIVMATVISYRVYANTMDEHYAVLTMNVAETAAQMVDSDAVETYTEAVKDIYLKNPAPDYSDDETAYFEQYADIKGEDYDALISVLERIKNANDVLYLYIVYMDPDSKTCVYVADADTSENACPAGTWDIIYEQNYGALQNLENGFPAYITHSDFGWLCSAGAAITDDEGNVIAHAVVDVSMEKVMRDRHNFLIRICLILLSITLFLTVVFIYLVNKTIINPLNSLAVAAASYVEEKEKGQMENRTSMLEEIKIHTGDEVENLADTIRQMAADINLYIDNLTAVTAEKERIGAELNVATHIQASMLPCIFPAFPERQEFDIYATMTPAKEVGGDFYDFFLVDEDHLAVVVADVSGKGVPAALFMVIAKTLIKDHAQTGSCPSDVFTEVNQQLCESNEGDMFVTAWMGILQISTGRIAYVNAGHNPPLICHAGGDFTYLRARSGFVLAGMEGMKYKIQNLEMMPGDCLYLYTDGVTEATDIDEQLYGEQRLEEVLNSHKGERPQQLLENVQKDITAFVKTAPQFDDITMLGLHYKGPAPEKKTLTVTADTKKLVEVQNFIESALEEDGYSMKEITQISVAAEELFVNIAHYAYPEGEGSAIITYCFDSREKTMEISFTDEGIPFNPLSKKDADVKKTVEEREIGGLGIYMVRKSMDHVDYQYKHGKNILSIKKKRTI